MWTLNFNKYTLNKEAASSVIANRSLEVILSSDQNINWKILLDAFTIHSIKYNMINCWNLLIKILFQIHLKGLTSTICKWSQCSHTKAETFTIKGYHFSIMGNFICINASSKRKIKLIKKAVLTKIQLEDRHL